MAQADGERKIERDEKAGTRERDRVQKRNGGMREGRKWRALRRNGAETGDSDGQWAPADSSNRTKTRSRGDRGRTTTPWLCRSSTNVPWNEDKRENELEYLTNENRGRDR